MPVKSLCKINLEICRGSLDTDWWSPHLVPAKTKSLLHAPRRKPWRLSRERRKLSSPNFTPRLSRFRLTAQSTNRSTDALLIGSLRQSDQLKHKGHKTPRAENRSLHRSPRPLLPPSPSNFFIRPIRWTKRKSCWRCRGSFSKMGGGSLHGVVNVRPCSPLYQLAHPPYLGNVVHRKRGLWRI